MRALAVVVLATAFLGSLPGAGAGQRVRPGQGLSIDVTLAPGGTLVADEVEMLRDARRLTLRGPLQAVDVALGRIRLLDRWIRVVPGRTEMVPEAEATLAELSPGEPVEVKVRDGTADPLEAREVERGAKTSSKVKGTFHGFRRRDGRAVLVVGGLEIDVRPHTDWVEADHGLRSELFGVLKSDEIIGEEGGYRRVGSHLFASGSLRPIARVEDTSLDEDDPDRRGIGEPSARLELLATLPGVEVFAQGRVRSRYEFYHTGGGTHAEAAEWEMRQLYVSARSLFGLPVGMTLGKQRVRDHREFLFDEYLDGARIYAYALEPLVLEASYFWPVAPRKEKYESWRDLLLQARLFPGEDWRASAYTLRRSDSSERGRDVRYWGASLEGKHRFLRVWGNGALLRGEDKGRRQEAWAWDAGIGLRARGWPLRPGVSLSAARGSGDDEGGDGVSREFRQPGYEDNSSRVWGLGSFRHFGEALDPELSNLEVLTATVGVRTASRFSVDLVGHRYALNRPADELEDVALEMSSSELREGVRALGHGVDAVLVLRDLVPGVHFTYKGGVFLPGRAFEAGTPRAWIHKFELRADF